MNPLSVHALAQHSILLIVVPTNQLTKQLITGIGYSRKGHSRESTSGGLQTLYSLYCCTNMYTACDICSITLCTCRYMYIHLMYMYGWLLVFHSSLKIFPSLSSCTCTCRCKIRVYVQYMSVSHNIYCTELNAVRVHCTCTCTCLTLKAIRCTCTPCSRASSLTSLGLL